MVLERLIERCEHDRRMVGGKEGNSENGKGEQHDGNRGGNAGTVAGIGGSSSSSDGEDYGETNLALLKPLIRRLRPFLDRSVTSVRCRLLACPSFINGLPGTPSCCGRVTLRATLS